MYYKLIQKTTFTTLVVIFLSPLTVSGEAAEIKIGVIASKDQIGPKLAVKSSKVQEKIEQISKQKDTPEVKKEKSKQTVTKRKLCLKGIIGIGIGYESVFTGIQKIEDGKTENIYISAGGGINIEGILGYHFIPSIMLALGIGYQSSGTAAGDDKVHFKRLPLTMNLIYQIPTRGSLEFYFGGGSGFYLAPEYYQKIGSTEGKIKYGSTFGFHGLAGLNYVPNKRSPFFFFGELKFAGGVKYKWQEASLNGASAVPTSEFRELEGNGILINFGINYSL